MNRERAEELLKAGDTKGFNEERPEGQFDLTSLQLPPGTVLTGVNLSSVILDGARLSRKSCMIPANHSRCCAGSKSINSELT